MQRFLLVIMIAAAILLLAPLAKHRPPRVKFHPSPASEPDVRRARPFLLLAADEEPRKIGEDVHRPKLIFKQEPKYTEEAREAKVEGTVLLSLTIDTDGSTKDIKVVRGLGYGLDEKAIEAASTWKFEPARLRKNNLPVAVSANVEINFRLL
jgi:TonB family protein